MPLAIVSVSQASAFVGIQHFGADEMILDHPAGDGVTVGGNPALLINIRLDSQTLTGMILIL